jgi:hypothetical protein
MKRKTRYSATTPSALKMVSDAIWRAREGGEGGREGGTEG